MERQIKLCIVSPLYHPSVGGPGRQAVAFAEKYFSGGGSVVVFCRKMLGLPTYNYNPNIKVCRIRSFYPQIFNLEGITFKNLLISLSFSIGLIISFLREKKEYDIVHFYGAGLPLVLSVLLLKIMGKKVVVTVLATNLGNEAGSFKNRYFPLGFLMTNILKMVDIFIAMSEDIEGALLNDGFKKDSIIKISNWVDTNKFYPIETADKRSLRKKLGLNESIAVFFVGRLVYRKGVDLLIKAWEDVVVVHPSCTLLIAGIGEEQEKLKNLCRDLGIEGNVLFLGHINNVEEYFKVIDLFVLPSLLEGMPNTLLEAMACRLPVIGTKIGGVVDIIKDRGNGLIVTPGNVEELKDAILTLLENKYLSEAIAEKAYNTIIKSYTIDKVLDKYVLLYKKVLGAI
jgi:glycosyltransferase involved in cell wall biosynthesis